MHTYFTQSARITSPRLLTFVQVLFGINALLWLVTYLTSFSRLKQTGLSDGFTALTVTGLMGGSAIAMLLAGILLTRRCRFYMYLTTGIVVFNILMAVFGKSHLINPVMMLVDLVILALLPMLHTDQQPFYYDK